jgi:hypothetical protein
VQRDGARGRCMSLDRPSRMQKNASTPRMGQAAAACRGGPVGSMNGALGGTLYVDLGRR